MQDSDGLLPLLALDPGRSEHGSASRFQPGLERSAPTKDTIQRLVLHRRATCPPCNGEDQEPTYDDMGATCAICYGSLDTDVEDEDPWTGGNGIPYLVVACVRQHVFHTRCLIQWMRQPNGTNCPECAQPMFQELRNKLLGAPTPPAQPTPPRRDIRPVPPNDQPAPPPPAQPAPPNRGFLRVFDPPRDFGPAPPNDQPAAGAIVRGQVWVWWRPPIPRNPFAQDQFFEQDGWQVNGTAESFKSTLARNIHNAVSNLLNRAPTFQEYRRIADNMTVTLSDEMDGLKYANGNVQGEPQAAKYRRLAFEWRSTSADIARRVADALNTVDRNVNDAWNEDNWAQRWMRMIGLWHTQIVKGVRQLDALEPGRWWELRRVYANEELPRAAEGDALPGMADGTRRYW